MNELKLVNTLVLTNFDGVLLVVLIKRIYVYEIQVILTIIKIQYY